LRGQSPGSPAVEDLEEDERAGSQAISTARAALRWLTAKRPPHASSANTTRSPSATPPLGSPLSPDRRPGGCGELRKEGTLAKRGWWNPGYKRRFFVLLVPAGAGSGHAAGPIPGWLDYFAAEEDWTAGRRPLGSISLAGGVEQIWAGGLDEGMAQLFVAAAAGRSGPPERTFVLGAESEEERDAWVAALQEVAATGSAPSQAGNEICWAG
jgi:hypothetical protein